MKFRAIHAALAGGLLLAISASAQTGGAAVTAQSNCLPRRAATAANCKTIAVWKDGLKDFSNMVDRTISDQREAGADCPSHMPEHHCTELTKARDVFAAAFRKDADKAILHAAWLLDRIDVSGTREAVEAAAGAVGDDLAAKLQALDTNFRSAVVDAISARVDQINGTPDTSPKAR